MTPEQHRTRAHEIRNLRAVATVVTVIVALAATILVERTVDLLVAVPVGLAVALAGCYVDLRLEAAERRHEDESYRGDR